MGTIDYLLIFLALGMMIGLPVMVLRSLARSGRAQARQDGDGWVMRPSRASIWAAVFCLVPLLGVAMRLRAGQTEPDFSPWNSGPAAGIALAVFALLVAIGLVVRWRLRVVRYDGEGITLYGRQRDWSELAAAGIERRVVEIATPSGASVRKYPDSAAVLHFRDGRVCRIRDDIEGRRDFDAFLKRLARERGIPFSRTDA